MYIRVKDRANGKKSIQIVESHRRGNQVFQKIVRHVGQAETDREVEELKKLAESIIVEVKNQRQPVLPLFKPEDIYGKTRQETDDVVKISNLREEQRIIDGIGDVFGKLYDDLGLNQTLGKNKADEPWNAALKACVMARLANPASKRRTASLLEEDYGIKIPVEKLYRMMDRTIQKENEIKGKIAEATLSLFRRQVEVLFFDVTTLYFESIKTDDLREFGFSKDCKFKESQVVLSLVTSTAGLPVGYQLFPGNMYEGNTLISMIDELQKVYDVTRVLLVADRAMFNEANLSLMEERGIDYIVAARLRQLPRDLRQSILSAADFSPAAINNEFHWVKEFTHRDRRLIVSYSSARAKKDAQDRSRLVERLLKKVKDGKVRVSAVIPNYGSKKFLRVKNNEAEVNHDKIAADALWDGLHGVISNCRDLSPSEILSCYRGLWQIEEAFRVSKHDLKMRPIYHWTPERIRAHILICFMAFAVAKQAVYRMSLQQFPLSFEQMRNELLHVQSSIVTDISTKKRYLLPSKLSLNQQKIYQAFGLKRSVVPCSCPR